MRHRLSGVSSPIAMTEAPTVSTETTSPTPDRTDFIREIVAADLRAGRHDTIVTRFPPGAQRLPAHRPRQVDLPQLRHRRRVRRPLPPALRRHQPGQGGAGVHRRHRGGRPLARLRLGRAPVPRVGLLRAALRVGRPPDRARQGLRRRPVGRRDPRAPRHADRAGPQLALARDGPSRRASTCSRGCAPASSRTAHACCARRSTWRRRTSSCATRCCTGSCTPRTPARATRGASTRPTTTPTASRTRSRA